MRTHKKDDDGISRRDFLTRTAAVGVGATAIVPGQADAQKETVARYNDFTDAGVDADFGKPAPLYKIEQPPFYAAWSTPLIHDSYAGLRTNPFAQVMDLEGEVIEGLYCAGESQGGFNQHGLGQCLVFGRIAGRHAALS